MEGREGIILSARRAIIMVVMVVMAVAALCGENRAHAQGKASFQQSFGPSNTEELASFSSLSPQSVIQASSPADTVHFCLPADPDVWEGGSGISAAKRQGDLNVGEPRTVRMIYFSPNDRPYRSSMADSIKTMIEWAQRFYAQRMQLHGYGEKTFRFETDEQGEPLIHRMDGQHPDSSYHANTLHEVLGEVQQAFDLRANVYFIVTDNTGLNTYAIRVNGLWAAGVGSRRGKNGGYLLLPRQYLFHTLSHELGHAFGLQHDFHNDVYVMSYGLGGLLSECSAGFLAVHPYFSPNSPIEEGSLPNIELVSSYTYPPGSVSAPVQFQARDPEGLHQAILFTRTTGFHPGHGSLEVSTCRGLADAQDVLVEFDYDGTRPSVNRINLSNQSIHSMRVDVVDTDGDVIKKSFILSEASPNHIATLEGHTQRVISVSFSPAGTILASASADHTIRLWDMSTGKNIAVLKGHKGQVNSVSFSLDGTTLASAGHYTNGTIRLWDVSTEENIAILEGHRGAVSVVSFSPDGMMLASGSGSNSTVELWDVMKRTSIAVLKQGTGTSVISISFSPDGTTLAASSRDVINLWDVATKQHIATLSADTNGLFFAVSFSPDEKILASTEARTDDTIRLWDVATKENIARLKGHKGFVISVAFSPDGTILASASIDGTIKLWNIATKENIVTLTGHAASVSTVSFSPDGTILASGADDNTVQLWDVFEWASVVPDAPVNLQATPGSEQVSLSWEAPVDDRGSEITGYAFRHEEYGGAFSEWADIPDSGSGGENEGGYTVTGLKSETMYTFELRAANIHGGGRSASVNVTLPPGPTSTESEELPAEVALLGNYPNPFNPETTIGYALPRAGKVRLAVYDLLGHEVAVLVDGLQPAGRHAVHFRGDHLPSGPYAYRLQAGDEAIVRTMVLVK